MSQQHSIKKQILDITLDSHADSAAVQDELAALFKSEIIPVLDRVCSSLTSPGEILRIEKLEIDVGELSREHVAREFADRLARLIPEKITEASLRRQSGKLASTPPKEGVSTALSGPEQEFELFAHVIRNGTLPWWTPKGKVYSMRELLTRFLREHPGRVKVLLETICRKNASLLRFCRHLAPGAAEKVYALFGSSGSAGQGIYLLQKDLFEIFRSFPGKGGLFTEQLERRAAAAFIGELAASGERGISRRKLVEAAVRPVSQEWALDFEHFLSQTLLNLTRKGQVVDDEPARQEERASVQGKDPADRESNRFPAELKKVRQVLEELLRHIQREPLPGGLPQNFNTLLRELTGALEKLLAITGSLLALEKDSRIPASEKSEALIEQFESGRKEFDRIVPALSRLTGKLLEAETGRGPGEERTEGNPADTGSREKNFSRGGREGAKEPARKKRTGFLEKLAGELGKLQSKPPGEKADERDTPFTESRELYVSHAGLVILWPYLAGFFRSLALVKDTEFVSPVARQRAVLLLHYLCSGREEAAEHDLALHKIVCGLEPEDECDPAFTLEKGEREECEKLLTSVLTNWGALKNTSIHGLRSMFLVREGIIRPRDGSLVLQVEQQAYDILLDRMMWGIGTVKLPWMKKILFVEWR